MATLLDIANASDSTVKQGFIRNIVDTSAALNFINFESAPTLRYEFASEGDLPDPAFRPLNTDYTASEGSFERNQVHLKPFGGKFTLDRKLKNITTFDGNSWAAKQLEMMSRAVSLDFKRELFKGAVADDSAAFNGLQEIVPSGQSIDYNGQANGDQLDVASEIIDSMNQAIDACESMPTVIFCNRTHLNDINTTVITAAANNALAQYFTWEIIEINGLRRRVGNWQGIQMIPVDNDSNNSAILAFDETQGSSSIASSMYFVVSSPGMFTAIQDQPVEITIYEDGSGTNWTVDWALNIAMEHSRSVTRLQGILA